MSSLRKQGSYFLLDSRTLKHSILSVFLTFSLSSPKLNFVVLLEVKHGNSPGPSLAFKCDLWPYHDFGTSHTHNSPASPSGSVLFNDRFHPNLWRGVDHPLHPPQMVSRPHYRHLRPIHDTGHHVLFLHVHSSTGSLDYP